MCAVSYWFYLLLVLGVSQINEPIATSEPWAVGTAADYEVSNLKKHTMCDDCNYIIVEVCECVEVLLKPLLQHNLLFRC